MASTIGEASLRRAAPGDQMLPDHSSGISVRENFPEDYLWEGFGYCGNGKDF